MIAKVFEGQTLRICGSALWVCVSLPVLVGCASMTRDGSRQTVLIRTQPPGATIYQGDRVLGRTPELIEIERGSHPSIQLATASGKKEVTLPTTYRWRKSFLRGLVFFGYAPVAWAIDMLSGTAWDVDEMNPIQIQLAKQDQTPKTERNPRLSVIAPPRSSSAAMSDDGAKALERVLREGDSSNSKATEVRPYSETFPIFIEQDYELGSRELNSKLRLQRALKADTLYESVVEQDNDGWVLKSEAIDIYSQQRRPGPTLRLGRDAVGPRVFGVGFGLRPWWSRILPDTVGLDFIRETMQIHLLGQQYALQPVHGEEWWAQGLKYLSAINISSTPDFRRQFGSRWEFGAVPSFTFSRRTLKAVGLPSASGQFVESEPEFVRWNVAGGYGLELGYLFGRHYLYFDIIPIFNWSQISWRQSGRDQQATRTGVTARAEFGYSYLFESNLLLRIFSRSQGENAEVWSDAFNARLGQSYTPTTVQASIVGVTLGYRFDTDRYQVTPSRTM